MVLKLIKNLLIVNIYLNISGNKIIVYDSRLAPMWQ